jgi:tetratricopeptide (TPR) repeat protein
MDYAHAIADYDQAILLNAKTPTIYNNLAWLLATSPQAGLRDGKKALEDAMTACELTYWQSPENVDTLAAAYAETGDFADAVKWESSFLAMPNLAEKDAADGRNRLNLYKAHKPYHLDK